MHQLRFRPACSRSSRRDLRWCCSSLSCATTSTAVSMGSFMAGRFTAAVTALLIFGIRYGGMGLVDQFKKEAATGGGAILPEDVPILASAWGRLRQRLRAFRRGGMRGYLEVARLQNGQLDIA